MHGLEQELRRHAGALRALALRLVGPAHADDLVQETSLLAWTQRPDERGGLGGWLRAVLRHRAGKLRRGEARRAQREQSSAHGEAASPADVVAQREAMTALHDSLIALPAPYQGVLLQRFFQDLTPTQIAQQNGVPVATVKSQLQRGLALLRERLDADGRRDWRAAFAGAFAVPRTMPIVAAATGAMLMSTKLLGLGVAAVAALLCVVFWPEAGAAPPAVSARDQRAVVAAATKGEATSETPQRHEVVAAAAPVPAASAAPLRLRVVDAFDGAPLPAFWVRIERPGVENAPMSCSDERGELTIDGALRGQELEVVAIDDASVKDPPVVGSHRIRAGDWPPAGELLDVLFAVGPTYRVLFDVEPRDEQFAAVLVAGNPRHAERDRARPMRRGPPPWIRFPAAGANPSELGDGPWSLVVYGSGWMATGRVQQVRGVQSVPVLLRVVACGTLRIEATIGGERARFEHGVHSAAFPLDETGEPQQDSRLFFEGQSGRVDLPVGRYRVFVAAADRQGHSEDVVIRASATTVVRAALPAAAERTTLQVVLRSQTGTRNVGTVPAARRVSDGVHVDGRYLAPREEGALVYELDLLPGEWDVSIWQAPHLPPWDSTKKRVRADAGTVEFTCLDAGAPPPGHGRVRVYDAATKKAIEGAGVTTLLQGVQDMATTDSGGIARVGPSLAGQVVGVLVRAAGYAPAWFEMTPVADAEPPPREVALRPGWGTLLTIVRPAKEWGRGEGLPGVRVLADGVLAGTTDANGFLLLSTAARPARLQFLHDDYVHQYGGADAATGVPDSHAQSPFFVVMEPKQAK